MRPLALATDVFFSTYPKCGTTLFPADAAPLTDAGDMSYNEITEVVPWLESPPGNRNRPWCPTGRIASVLRPTGLQIDSQMSVVYSHDP
ncbi:MAG: hypothetical protein CM1200mP18_03400 [Gammaproteobacteria bacterium]|nr:MAG: hypothetical protein CM1200mP18_03400 [Gammaproteobacteria bacterium]